MPAIKPKTAEIALPAYGWCPRDYQKPLWSAMRSNAYDEFFVAWHRRTGKDEIALQDTAIRAMTRVGNYWHTLPLKEQARKAIWNGVNPKTGRRRWEDAFPKEIIKFIDNESMFIEFINGSTWQLIGSDHYDNLVGSSAVHIVFSEAALCNPMSFAFLRPIIVENKGTALYISTVRGRNHFYSMYQNALSDERAFTTHLSATASGVFSMEQLEKERQAYIAVHGVSKGTSLFEQEYLSNWDTADVGSIFGKEIASLYEENRMTATVRHDPTYPVFTFWDLGVRDPTVVVFAQFIANSIHVIDLYADVDVGMTKHIDKLVELARTKGYNYGGHFAPHDISQRELTTGLSRLELIRNMGLEFTRVPTISKQDQIAMGSNALGMSFFADPATKPLVDYLASYRYHYNMKTMMLSKNPYHDMSSHYADAYLLLAMVWQADMRLPKSQRKLVGLPLFKKNSKQYNGAITRSSVW